MTLRSLFFALLAFTVLPASARPNILVILTDDHRYDAMGFLGHPFLKTPHLDRLAAEGVLFKNAYVTTSLCSPSRASILSGLYAHNHRVVDNYNPVSKSLTFFPELLQRSGYQTAFIGKWHMGDNEKKQRGFDHWLSFKGQGVYVPDPNMLKAKGRFVPQATNSGFNLNGKKIPQKGYVTDELTDYAEDWLAAKDDEKPFLLYVSHKGVHADFLPPDRHAFKYDKVEIPTPPTPLANPDLFTDSPMWVRNQNNSRHGVEFAYYTGVDMKKYYRRYCEALLAVDDSVGRLIANLEKSGELENTVVLYLGDNGFIFGEHGLIEYIRYHGVWDLDELYNIRADSRERTNLFNDPVHQSRIEEMNTALFELLEKSSGQNMPLLPDRGTKYFHRKVDGSKGASFSESFYRKAGTSGK